MNPKRISLFVLVTIAAFAGVFVVTLFVVAQTARQPALVKGDRIANALAQYTRELRARGDPPPKSVTVDTLVRSGFLTGDDAKPFEGADVIFYADASDTDPQNLIMEARMPDGQVQAVLADGSVQQFSAKRWAELRKTQGRPTGAANRSQPVRSEPNRASVAAGSGR